MRNITVYSTAGKNTGVITTDVKTYGELKLQLMENQFQVEGMKAVVGETRVSLEVDGSVLPEADFKLFLMPFKTKSGVDYSTMSRSGLITAVQNYIAKEGDTAKEYFNSGENFTRKKSTELVELLENFRAESQATVGTNDIEVSSDTITVKKEDLLEILDFLLNIDDLNFDAETNLDLVIENLKAICYTEEQAQENSSNNSLKQEAAELAREFGM